MKPEIEITYAVLYQKPGDSTWWEFTNDKFKHKAPGGLNNETYDLAEALTARP